MTTKHSWNVVVNSSNQIIGGFGEKCLDIAQNFISEMNSVVAVSLDSAALNTVHVKLITTEPIAKRPRVGGLWG